MYVRRFALSLVSLAVVAVLNAAPPSVPVPTVTFESSAVMVSGITPKGSVLIVSVSYEMTPYSIRRRPVAVTVADTDGDGIVRLEVPTHVQRRSVWAAVDLATGGHTVVAGPGGELDHIELPGQGLHKGGGGQLDHFESGRETIMLAWVRPGVGAWRALVSDGGPADEDHRHDGRLQLSAAHMWPIDKSPAPPERYMPGDVLIAIDYATLEVYASEVAK